MKQNLTLRIILILSSIIFSGVVKSVPIICADESLNAVGIRIDNGGSNTQINTTTEALAIHSAWLNAGSPSSGLIDGGTYNVAASGTSTADRIDFGGSNHDFSGTLPYPGASAGVSGSDFLVHTSGKLSLPAGNYTIFVESDDGFSFIMDTVSGDTVTFNKFGSSNGGASNELRFENPTANANTGGSFILTQDSVFDIAAIFYERGGGDYLEISISNDIRANSAPSGYEILRSGALNGKVKLGQCSTPPPLLEYLFEEDSWNGSAGEIIDNSGNNHHARIINGSSPIKDFPALTGDPGTCGYASQTNGAIQVTGLPLDTSTIGVKTTVAFWMNWDGTDNTMPIGWNIHDIWIIGGSFGFNTGNSDIYGISSAGLANGWHHVVVEFTNGSVVNNRIHIDGVEQVLTQRRSSPNNSRAFVDSELRIGGWSRDSNYNFHGLIDEVKVYQDVLTTSQVNIIMQQRHACPIKPLAEYRFDELTWTGSTNDVLDTSGNSLHGISQGTSPVTGLLCNAADFDRSNRIQVANNALLDVGNNNSDYTVNFWINPRSTTGGWSNIIHKGNINYERTFSAWFRPGDSRIHHRASTTSNANEGHDTSAISLNSWTMVTLVKDDNQLLTYFNGILDSQTTLAGSSVSNNGPLYIGDDPWYVGIDALMDELTIFGGALTSTEIQDIRTNNLAGNGWDGSIRNCPMPAVPLLEFRFEENSWNGTAGEVIDSTGNGYNGRVNNNSTPGTSSPALTGDPGTCGFASQNDGAIEVQGLPLDTTTAGVKTTVTFWMNWDGTNNVMPIGWRIHDIWMINGDIGFNTGQGDLYGVSSAGLANGWHHIAVEFTNGSVTSNRMYIDGGEQVLTQRRSSPNNSRAYVDSELRIGGWSINSGYDFHGLIDEVRVYESVLTTAQVNEIMSERHPCLGIVPDHYEILHDGNGLTCDTETITIKACSDAICSSLSTDSVTLDVLGNGTLINSLTFTGSAPLSFDHTVMETLTLSLANTSLIASNPFVCDNGINNSCDIVFTDAGFRFLDGTNNSPTLLNQTAGSVFSEIKVQAVQTVNGVCTALFNGNKDVDLSQENVDPGGTSGLNFTINNTTSPLTIAKQGNIPGATSVTLNFGANSIATILAPIYHDAGQIRLHANYDVGGVTLTGSSNSFWVSPAELVVNAKSGGVTLNGDTAGTINLDGITPTPTHKAGEDFELSVSALNSLGVITPNYSPGQIQLLLTRTGPTLVDSLDGNLTFSAANSIFSSTSPIFQNVNLSNFISGESVYSNANYSEVGLINLDVQDFNYGNANITIPATAINIGRFTPDHFQQSVVVNGAFMATCNSGTEFAYSGQKDEATDSIGAISYVTNPIMAVTAYNKQGDITQNYFEDAQGSTNDYMKLNSSGINLTLPTLDQVATGVDSTLLSLTANMNAGTLSQNDLTQLPNVVALPKGVLHYQLSDNDNFFYNRSANAIVQPFPSDIDFFINTIIDSDNVDLIRADSTSSTAEASPDGVEIRFGRLVLENSFGPETSSLPQPMKIEHFDGTKFIVTANNNCVNYDSTKMLPTNISLNPANTNVLGGVGVFVGGQTNELQLEAQGAGNQGQMDVTYDIFDWLKFDWNNDGTFDNPSAVASFGVYRGNDRIIYSREVYD